MKKFLLVSLLVFVFGAFVIKERFLPSEDASGVVTPPASLTNTTPDSGQGSPVVTSSTPPSNTSYKDGAYIGDSADAFYGNVQVQATISGGKITDVQFLQYPNDRGTSVAINSQAMPYLKQEAIAAQSAQVDTISGASQTSNAFRISLASALSKAK